MRYLCFVLALFSGSAFALDKITDEAIKQLLSQHSTFVMQKEPEKLMALFADKYQQFNKKQQATIGKDELKKIYNGNFLVAKLIINTIQLTDSKIADGGLHAQISTHVFNRYLIEYAEKQNVLTQEEDWHSELVLENGQLLYLKTEK
ncbi:MAG: hypothetical protein Q7S87_07500 [Agitococcus sp.]|nr:hypothetical protein [Agitococcus sp.]